VNEVRVVFGPGSAPQCLIRNWPRSAQVESGGLYAWDFTLSGGEAPLVVLICLSFGGNAIQLALEPRGDIAGLAFLLAVR
jgi:hypothetical protein